MTINLNALSATLPDRAATLHYMATCGGKMAVSMDDPASAIFLAGKLPTSIHRQYEQGDDSLHHKYDAGDYLERVRANGSAQGVWQQILNEPQAYGDVWELNRWQTALCERAVETNTRVVIGNYAVYHPDRALVRAGAFDSTLTYACKYPHLIHLGAHEYFVDNPALESERVGRFMVWRERAAQLKLPNPIIDITEAGRDIAGGHDGWKSAGWSELVYAQRLRMQAAIYRLYGMNMAVFCAGNGFNDRWNTFNVWDASVVLKQIVAYNGQEGAHVNWTSGYLTPKGSYVVNVRDRASTDGAILLRIPVTGCGAEVAEDSAGDWLHVRIEGVEGYAAAAYLTFKGGAVQWAELVAAQLGMAQAILRSVAEANETVLKMLKEQS